MSTIINKPIGLLAVGELLMDVIGTEIKGSLYDTDVFEKYQGGSPSNLAANMARLGQKVAIVSAVGKDNFGLFLVDEVAKIGIDTSHIQRVDEPTSIVMVSRTTGTPDFIAYRTADKEIYSDALPNELLNKVSIFHTTCFALSKNPSQSSIVEAAQKVAQLGGKLSIDCNYAPSIWPDNEQAWQVIKNYVKNGAMVKLSEDDAQRLYGTLKNTDDIIADFHAFGASLVCFTLGSKGAWVSFNSGADRLFVEPKKIDVVDATGAGDAFWSGFLTGILLDKEIGICAIMGSNMAVKKLTLKGPLPPKVPLIEILN